MINLETPRKFRPLRPAGPPGRRASSCAPTRASTTSPSTPTPRSSTSWPRSIDGMGDSGTGPGRRRRRRRASRTTRRQDQGQGQERHQHVVGALGHRDVLGRRRPAAVDAPPGPRQLGDRLGRQRRAARALQGHVGRDGDHRAQLRLGLGRHQDHGGQGRRRLRPQRREDLRHVGRARRLRRRVGHARQDARPRGDQVVPRAQVPCRASGSSGSSTSSASAPPTRP